MHKSMRSVKIGTSYRAICGGGVPCGTIITPMSIDTSDNLHGFICSFTHPLSRFGTISQLWFSFCELFESEEEYILHKLSNSCGYSTERI